MFKASPAGKSWQQHCYDLWVLFREIEEETLLTNFGLNSLLRVVCYGLDDIVVAARTELTIHDTTTKSKDQMVRSTWWPLALLLSAALLISDLPMEPLSERPCIISASLSDLSTMSKTLIMLDSSGIGSLVVYSTMILWKEGGNNDSNRLLLRGDRRWLISVNPMIVA